MSRASPEFPIVLVKNLPYEIDPEEIYELFGTFGNILQVRKGVEQDTRGTALVVYQNVKAASLSVDKLNGYNFNGRYLVCLPYSVDKTGLDKEVIRQELLLNDIEK